MLQVLLPLKLPSTRAAGRTRHRLPFRSANLESTVIPGSKIEITRKEGKKLARLGLTNLQNRVKLHANIINLRKAETIVMHSQNLEISLEPTYQRRQRDRKAPPRYNL
jgi:hypothetical protein